MLEALHIGPDVYSFGGTQSVIRTIRDHSIGADHITTVSTWDGPDQAKNARLMLNAGRTLARARRGTVAHFHISNGGAWLREGPLIVLARTHGLRVVVSLHGFEFPEFARKRPRFVRAVLSKAHHVVCLSGDAHATVTRLLESDNVTVLANPVAIDRASPPAEETPPIALFAGTIGLRKGVDILVDAWRALLDDGLVGELHIVGPIDDFTPPDLERLVMARAVHPNDVAALLRTVRLIVLPSRAEAMPMILAEALAAARPFVATAVGGTREITPDPDMIVPVEDVGALSSAMARYLCDGALAGRAGRCGQQYVIATRSPEVVGARLRRIYERIEI
jgi:glycosyltransferase involved in cell wall biosynthesis